jgi:hypothetical protein
LPTVNSHTPPWSIPTWCYISTNNNPTTVNQPALIVFWLNEYPRTRSGAYGDAWTFTIDVTKPDNSVDKLGPFTSDPVGSCYTTYTPTQVGVYKFVANFPGATYTGLPLYPGKSLDPDSPNPVSGADYINDTVLPSSSDPLLLTVNQDVIQSWQEAPLPTQYWTRPVNVMNRDWDTMLSNWLGGSAQNYPQGAGGAATSSYSYSPGPDSPHILWATPYTYGGVMDARFGDIGFQTSHYDGIRFDPPIIIDGRLYVNQQWQPKEGWYCIDLYTGETLYYHNTSGPVNYALRSDASGALLEGWLSFGQILNYESPNEHGGRPYLWSTYGPGMPTGTPTHGGQSWPNGNETWMMFDAWSGDWLLNVANVSTTGTEAYGTDGSILYYSVSNRMYGKTNADGVTRLTVWNSTHAVEMNYEDMRNYYWCWRPYLNMTVDGSKGFSVNVTISPAVRGSIYAVREQQYIIGGTSGTNNEDGNDPGVMWALSLVPGEEGKLLWNKTYTAPSSAGNLTMSSPQVDPEDGMFFFSETKTRTRWGYSLDTMQEVWKSDPESPWNYYGMRAFVYNGKLISTGSGMTAGTIVAYDAKSGQVLWTYEAKNIGYESPYGNYPLSLSCITSDGKIITYSSEHSPTMPLWRGSMLRCIDSSNGQELWKINNWGNAVAADNVLVSLNYYDMRLYCYGKGPSATTATVAQSTIAKGDPIVIQGTVTDQSPGAKGTPAIADQYMQQWMEYQYMQQGKPADATGVTVKLTAIDPNGNLQNVGTTTTNTLGHYAIAWTPPIPGLYQVKATFEGTKSYFGSEAETAFAVSQQTSTQTSPSASTTSAPLPPTSATPTATYVAIGTAIIIIVAAATVLIFRRRKKQ